MNLRCHECGEYPAIGDNVLAKWNADGTHSLVVCLECYADWQGVTLSTLKAFIAACEEFKPTSH